MVLIPQGLLVILWRPRLALAACVQVQAAGNLKQASNARQYPLVVMKINRWLNSSQWSAWGKKSADKKKKQKKWYVLFLKELYYCYVT